MNILPSFCPTSSRKTPRDRGRERGWQHCCPPAAWGHHGWQEAACCCCQREQMAGEEMLQDLLPVKSCPLEVEA